MSVDERLLEILVCPSCRGELQYKERRRVLVCEACAVQYPVREDIPVLLPGEASPLRQR